VEKHEIEYLEAAMAEKVEALGSQKAANRRARRWPKVLAAVLLAAVCAIVPFKLLESGIVESAAIGMGGAAGTLARGLDKIAEAAGGIADPQRTYVDGRGFAKMMSIVTDGIEAANAVVEAVDATNGEIGPVEASEMKEALRGCRDALMEADVHSSYLELVQASYSVLCAYESLLDLAASGADPQTMNALLDQISGLQDARTEAMLEAFEANSIDYSVEPDGSVSYRHLDY